MRPKESWASVGAEELALRLRAQTDCGHPDSGATSGLVAYLDDEPVGWCAVVSRAVYARLLLKTTRSLGRQSRGQSRPGHLGRHLLRYPCGLPQPRDQPRARARRR